MRADSKAPAQPNTPDIGILGGAYDPPHFGHLAMAWAALSLSFCKEVWLMPSPNRWDKTMRTPFAIRIELIDVIIQTLPEHVRQRVRSSSFEGGLGDFRGSLHLIRQLSQNHANATFGFIMGSDTLLKTSEWYDPRTNSKTGSQFLEQVPVLVFGRAAQGSEERPPKPQHLHSRCVPTLDELSVSDPALESFLKAHRPLSALSSTVLREEISQLTPETDASMLTRTLGEELLKTIKVRGLYTG